MEYEKGTRIIREILGLLEGEENRERAGILDTPRRVVKSWWDLYAGYRVTEEEINYLLRPFPEEEYRTPSDPITVEDIPFFSTCEHHLLPFYGIARVSYTPSPRGLIGLSKIPRVVHAYSRRLQVQERITVQVAEAVARNSRGATVTLEGKHLCLAARGVEARETFMSTTHYAEGPRIR